jgi:HAMP domain-containing protein
VLPAFRPPTVRSRPAGIVTINFFQATFSQEVLLAWSLRRLIGFVSGGGSRPLSWQMGQALLVICLASLLLASIVLTQLFDVQARALIDQRSNFFLDSMMAVREYTSRKVNPIVAPLNQDGDVFRPEAVPSYSATSVFEYLKAQPDYRNYSYREATLNPTNLKDKADPYEAGLVDSFRADSSLKLLSGDRATPLGTVHYVAKPIRITKESCLVCHSTPARAPRSQILTYGSDRGFGWKLNEVVGSQIVSVPIQEVITAKNHALMITVSLLLLALLLVGFVTNSVLNQLILRPMRLISLKADEASVTPPSVSFDEKARGDEIGLLARSFERMKQSLAISMQMIKDRRNP